MARANRQAFEDVARRLDAGEDFTFTMIGEIFGQEFWVLLVYTLMDANDAARAISDAISSLRGKKDADEGAQTTAAADGGLFGGGESGGGGGGAGF